MGGRGAISASAVSAGVERYRIMFGDKALSRLKTRGASDATVSKVYETFRANRDAGMGKNAARMAAEEAHGVGSGKSTSSGSNTAKSAAKTKASSSSSSVPKAFSDRYKAQGFSNSEIREIYSDTLKTRSRMKSSKKTVNGFGEATTGYVTTPGYERAQKRQQKAVLRNMGY